MTCQPLWVILCRLPEKGRKEIGDSRGDEKEGQGRERNRNENEETEEIKHSPSTFTCYKDSRPCPTVSQYQLDAPMTHKTRREVLQYHRVIALTLVNTASNWYLNGFELASSL